MAFGTSLTEPSFEYTISHTCQIKFRTDIASQFSTANRMLNLKLAIGFQAPLKITFV
jgi:hypothetical protein